MFYGWFEPTKGPKTFRYGYMCLDSGVVVHRERKLVGRLQFPNGHIFGGIRKMLESSLEMWLILVPQNLMCYFYNFSPFFPENYVADQRHWPWDVPDQRKIWGKKTHRYQSRDTLSKLAQVSNIRKRNNHFCNTILSHLIIGQEESASFNRWIENQEAVKAIMCMMHCLFR